MGIGTGKPSIETIIKDPMKHFGSPREVVADQNFTIEEKRRILEEKSLHHSLVP